MKLNEYQEQAMSTCLPACENLPYMLFNLQGEVGELSSKVAKAIRKGFISISTDGNELNDEADGFDEWLPSYLPGLKAELGDVLWQLAGLSYVLGFSLEDVAQYNLDKLASRKQRGVIDGDGDNR